MLVFIMVSQKLVQAMLCKAERVLFNASWASPINQTTNLKTGSYNIYGTQNISEYSQTRLQIYSWDSAILDKYYNGFQFTDTINIEQDGDYRFYLALMRAYITFKITKIADAKKVKLLQVYPIWNNVTAYLFGRMPDGTRRDGN